MVIYALNGYITQTCGAHVDVITDDHFLNLLNI